MARALSFVSPLRQARQDAGLSVPVAAVSAGISPGHLGLIERGVKIPSVATLLRVARVVGLDDLAAALEPFVLVRQPYATARHAA